MSITTVSKQTLHKPLCLCQQYFLCRITESDVSHCICKQNIIHIISKRLCWNIGGVPNKGQGGQKKGQRSMFSRPFSFDACDRTRKPRHTRKLSHKCFSSHAQSVMKKMNRADNRFFLLILIVRMNQTLTRLSLQTKRLLSSPVQTETSLTHKHNDDIHFIGSVTIFINRGRLEYLFVSFLNYHLQ